MQFTTASLATALLVEAYSFLSTLRGSTVEHSIRFHFHISTVLPNGLGIVLGIILERKNMGR